MYGGNTSLVNSGNRGHVHTLEIKPNTTVSEASKAANLGGVVGKIDAASSNNIVLPVINTSYNTGNVEGYLNIGGIIGQVYNGKIEHSHNSGNIKTTRHKDSTGDDSPINMGGVVGDATEMGSARAYIYDVYNKGTIGDEKYEYL